MGYSNKSIALLISKALFKHHRHGGAAASAPFSTATAVLNRQHVDSQDESGLTGSVGGAAKEAVVKATETVVGGAAKSRVEVAYDATKGAAEKVKDTVIAEANENVVDTTEYRSQTPPKHNIFINPNLN